MAVGSILKGLGLGKFPIPCCLCPSSSDGHLVDQNCVRVAQAACVFLCHTHCILSRGDEIGQVCVRHRKGNYWLTISRLNLKVLVMAVHSLEHFKQDNYSTVGGDGGCRVGEVRAGTTSPMPDHKGFKQQ